MRASMGLSAALLLVATLHLRLADAGSPDALPYPLEDAKNIITIRYKPEADGSSISLAIAAAEKLGLSAAPSATRRKLGETEELSLDVEIARDIDPSEAMGVLRQMPDVVTVEVEEWWFLVPGLEAPLDSEIGDDSTEREDLWSMEKIGAPTVWSRIASMERREVKVCVVDTGLDYTHPDLAPNMWINTAEAEGLPGVDDDGNGYIDDIHGWDSWRERGDPMDIGRHGSHCSGTVAGAGVRVYGAAGPGDKVKLIGCQAFTEFTNGLGALTSDIAECIDYCIAVGADIMSNSYGGTAMSVTVLSAVKRAEEAGILFVAASGNDNKNTDNIPHYPSNYEFGTSMGIFASDEQDDPAWFTNYGYKSVAVGAPGVYILSTVPGNKYANFSGTSMATPLVSGMAAVLMSVNPDLTAYDTKHILMRSTDEINSFTVTAGGRVNFEKALDLALGLREPEIGHLPNERFVKRTWDLDKYTITYTYDGWKGYTHCREKTGRTYPENIDGATILTMQRKSFQKITFENGFTFPFLGKEYSEMYLASNGYITFEKKETTGSSNLQKAFRRLKIAGFQGKLDPSAGGNVYLEYIGDQTLAVTFHDVPRLKGNIVLAKQIASFQMLLDADGTIRVHYSKITYKSKFIIGLFPGETPRHYDQADFSVGVKDNSCAPGCYTFTCITGSFK